MNGRISTPSHAGMVMNTPLHVAAWRLNADQARALIQAGADVNFMEDGGGNAGHALARNAVPAGPEAFAVMDGMKTMAQLLSANGLDWGARNSQGKTALAALAKMGPIHAIAAALESPDAIDFLGVGPGSALEILMARGGKFGELAQTVVDAEALRQASASAQPSKGARL
jgi:ankyrin repeat protein